MKKDHCLNPRKFKFEKIVSIELIGETDTIDIGVENDHMFYANDIYTHNSAANSEIAEIDSVAESFNKVMVADVVITLSRRIKDKMNNTGRIYVAKNRAGKDGLVYPIILDTSRVQAEIYDKLDEEIISKMVSSAQGFDMKEIINNSGVQDAFSKFKNKDKNEKPITTNDDCPF